MSRRPRYISQALKQSRPRRSMGLMWDGCWKYIRAAVLVGLIATFQVAYQLKLFGAQVLSAQTIGWFTARELGPLVGAIVLTGFAGASIAAELGTMVVSEEIEALRAQAINPIRFLVVPRVVATTVMMVCVAVVADLTGILGGLFVSKTFLGISTSAYLAHTFEAIKVRDFVTGLVKAGVFGTLISGLACHLGLSVTGGAQGVGVATTRTVVLTIVALILVDLMFTAVFFALGL